MSEERSDLLRPLADEIASLLSGNGGAALSLMQRLGVLTWPEENGAGIPRPRSRTIGIWEEASQGYRRSATRQREWTRWADVDELAPKGARKRVVLLGESVARGYFYDPELTPAQALESSLAGALGEPVEVVDLAKVDLLAPELVHLSESALALKPDALVIFAGNNWFVRNDRERCLEAAVLRQLGVPGLKDLRRRRLSDLVDRHLSPRFNWLATHQPLVLVIPEFNLDEWRLDAEADAPWLPPGNNQRWLKLREEAQSALAAGCFGTAQSLAEEMIHLDAGTAASGWTILADCARDIGDLDGARRYLEQARDSHMWNNTPQTPRVLSVVQQALRECASPGRIGIVDLPRCFSTWDSRQLPGGRLFLDYCHLTAEGIRVAMAATALEIANLFCVERVIPDLPTLVETVAAPSPRLEAEAHFAAAIHCAHWGQKSPMVSSRCRRAARLSLEVAQAMWEYLELQTRQAPTWSCAATERLSALASPALRRYILTYGQAKLFDPVLLPAIAEALEETGRPALAFLDQLRRNERGLTEHPCDLLAPYYRPSFADRDWLGWPTCFCRAYSPKSRYPWVASAPGEVGFELTCRRTNGSGECRLWINGSCVTHFSLAPEWTTLQFRIPAGLVHAGVNWLEIQWPSELVDCEKEVELIALDHEHGRPIPLLPVFADIFSLTAVQISENYPLDRRSE